MEWWQVIITSGAFVAAVAGIMKFLKPVLDVPYKIKKLEEMSAQQDVLFRGVYYLLRNATTGNSKAEMQSVMGEMEIRLKLRPERRHDYGEK